MICGVEAPDWTRSSVGGRCWLYFQTGMLEYLFQGQNSCLADSEQTLDEKLTLDGHVFPFRQLAAPELSSLTANIIEAVAINHSAKSESEGVTGFGRCAASQHGIQGCVLGCVSESADELLGVHGAAKVDEFDGLLLDINENIFWFDVSVDDAGSLTLDHRFHQLAEQGSGQLRHQVLLHQEGAEIHGGFLAFGDDSQSILLLVVASVHELDDASDVRHAVKHAHFQGQRPVQRIHFAGIHFDDFQSYRKGIFHSSSGVYFGEMSLSQDAVHRVAFLERRNIDQKESRGLESIHFG